uniref:Exported protein n=1 Tax=Strongyloides venezuelensis TaxID=75913 RepID=A0A0K0FIC4_STRVS
MLSNNSSKLLLTAAASLAVGFFICNRTNLYQVLNKPTKLNKTIDEECGEISSGVITSTDTDSTLRTITLVEPGKILEDRVKKLREERSYDNEKIENIISSSKNL